MRWLIAALLLCVVPAQAHDIYTDLKRPDTGTSCCSSWDCYPTEAQFKGGTWFALRREDRKWIAVPDHLILKNEITQDGKAHVCATRPEAGDIVYCFKPPESGS